MSFKSKVLILYTGGTFGMEIKRSAQGKLTSLSIPDLSNPVLKKRFKQQVPELRKIAQCDVEVVMNRDSSHIGPKEWLLMAHVIQKKWDQYDGFVILHGTDTLAYTASALSFLLRPCHKPVILTGAQRPLSAIRTDARNNLISSVELAAQGGPRSQKTPAQVMVFFGNALFQGNRIRKLSSTDFNAFESPQASPLAITGTTIRSLPKEKIQHPKKLSKVKLLPDFSTQVLMCHITPGFPAQALSTEVLSSLDALILVAFLSRTAPTHDMNFMKLIRRAKKLKIPVIITTEEGPSPAHTAHHLKSEKTRYSVEAELFAEGCLGSDSMTPECAYVKACFIAGQNPGYSRFKKLWKENLAHESLE